MTEPGMQGERIAVFVPSLRGGGAERAMLELAGGLCELGHAVDILVATTNHPDLRRAVPADARLIDFKSPRVSCCLIPLIRYLRSEKPSILFSSIVNANVVASLAGLAAPRTRVIVRESIVPVTDPKRTLRKRLIRFIAGRAYGLADGIIAVSHDVGDELARMNPLLRKKISVLPTPVVSSHMIESSRQAPSHLFFQEHTCPILLAAGRLMEQKGFDTLLKAFAKLRKRTEAKLILIGQGDLRENLERLAHELGVVGDVSFPGFVENPFSFFRHADLFVLSSRYEGMPNVLIQALALGTPVVATDCPGGPRECLEDGTLGVLVPVDNVEALAAGIETTLAQPPREGVALRIRTRFDVSRAAREYVAFARSCGRGRVMRC